MTISVLAPAKVNLGLEVIRKRDDGFHDIATVFQSISVFDRLRLVESDSDTLTYSNRDVEIESNLALTALERARDAGLTDRSWRIDLTKRIPMAAGLGGASADAAGVLTALADERSIDRPSLASLALGLGSDVPFLLTGGAALAHGQGERLAPLPALRDCWFVLVCPSIELARKTSRLYGALTPFDFSDGTRVDQVAAALRQHRLPEPDDLRNAFHRPIEVLIPSVATAAHLFQLSGAPFVALSGAGPTQYTLVSTLREAIDISGRLRSSTKDRLRVLVARPTRSGPIAVRGKTIDHPGSF